MLPKTNNNNNNICNSNVMQLKKHNNKNYIGKKRESTQLNELNKSKEEKKQTDLTKT